MGKYDPWDAFFADLDGTEHRFTLGDFEELAGVDLPPSAHIHAPWWANIHYYSKWANHGWFAHPRLRDGVVVFSRSPSTRGRPPGRSSRPKRRPLPVVRSTDSEVDLILMGCVSQKGDRPVRARDLYVSPLWGKRRAYAEASGKPWLILSAEHGLVDPDEVVAPYDRALASEPHMYRDQWSRSTAAAVIDVARRIGARTIEVHAGSAYLDSGLVGALEDVGLEVVRPLHGMRIGEQLSWYGSDEVSTPERAPDAAEPVATEPLREISGDHVRRIADDYANGLLGESWGELPETGVFRLPEASPVDARIWLTFICAMDRARDAERLWTAGLAASQKDPWVFRPAEVAARSFSQLADTLRVHGLSQRHAVDSNAWRTIGESLIADDCPQPIRSVVDGGPTRASDLLASLGAEHPGGTKFFPLLSGPKIGPMWVRMMVYPGGANVTGMEAIPVAVDTHVQRVTEMLGLVAHKKLDDRHRRDVQDVWFEGVRMAGPFGGPDGIDGTAAAIDPALWVLGKNGCTNCERAGRKIPIGTICDVCPLGRFSESE